MADVVIRATGKHVDNLVRGLIQGADDKNKDVQQSVNDALFRIGQRHPDMVISSCLNYLIANLKQLCQSHRVSILQIMERIVIEMLDKIEEKLSKELIKQATSEMIASKEIIVEWHTAAMNVLVATGKLYINEVMEELTLHFQPGILPHIFVVQTMGKLAAINAYGMVPFINVTLGTMLPMLGMAKQDNYRWVFSYTLSKFAEAIVYYVENIDQAPDKDVKLAVFSNEFFAAYDILFTVWLPQTKTAELRIQVVSAIGQASYIVSQAQLMEQLPKLLPAIIGLYKKQTDHLNLTLGLYSVLDAATKGGAKSLDNHFELVVGHLYSFACVPIDTSNSNQVKNQNELLRCFTVLNRSYSDRLVANLIQKLENKEEKARIGTLLIIKHLINSGGSDMEVKKALVISGLRILLDEPNLKVRKVFAQTIISMAHHGYLELEGGELMIEFIVKQCSIADESSSKKPATADPEHVTPQALRSMCESVLQLITNTIVIMEKVLWPYLLEFLIPVKYTDAAGTICKNLASLGDKKRKANDSDYLIDFEDDANLPKPKALVARLFILAGVPLNGRKRGEHVLKAMLALVPNLHQDMVAIWDEVIPKLIAKLEELLEEKEFNQKKWEEFILRLLSTSLDAVGDEEWVNQLGLEFGESLDCNRDYPEEKGFCFKCLGVVMRKSTKKELLQSQMELMFQKINHLNQAEQDGLAMSMGFTAASHFDAVLTKLEQVTRTESSKKSSGFIGFIKNKVDLDSSDVSGLRQTVVLAYGYVTLFAPIALVTSRLEAVILRNITCHFSNTKDPTLKKNLVLTIEMIGKTVDPSHLMKTHELSQRSELLKFLLGCIKQESTDRLTGKFRTLAFGACLVLVKLDPKLTDAEFFELVKTVSDSVFPLPADGVQKGKTESYEEQITQDELMSDTVASMNGLLGQMLLKDLSPNGFQAIFKHLIPWMVSSKDIERLRAVTTANLLLRSYLSNIGSANISGEFSILGSVIGNFVPRCTDPTIQVREESIMAIQSALRIQLVHQGIQLEVADKMVDALPVLKERLQKSDPTVLFGAVNDLSKVLAKKFPQSQQLIDLVNGLMEGLTDSQALCSNGACVVLNGITKLRGADLENQVSDYIERLHQKIPNILVEQTKAGALRCIKSIGSHHLERLLNVLLKYPLPYDSAIVEFWQVLAKETALVDKLITSCLEILQRNMPYDEKPNATDKNKMDRIVKITPLAVVSALRHILSVAEVQEVATNHFAALFTSILLKIGAYSGAALPYDLKHTKTEAAKGSDGKHGPKQKQPAPTKSTAIVPSSVVAETFRELLLLTDCADIVNEMDNHGAWQQLAVEENLISGIEFITTCFAENKANKIGNVVPCLKAALTSMYDTDRIVSTAFYGQLIKKKCGGDLSLVEVTVGLLLGRLMDSSIHVRMLCVRGLGNIAETGTEMVQKYSTTILSAMMSGMDDKDDLDELVTQEAMSGLSKIMAYMDESHIRPILINVALRIKPCFEKDKASVRAAAFELFGNLSRFGIGPSALPFSEQINGNLTSILLHLNDREDIVKVACKHTLKLLGPHLNSASLNTMFQKNLIDSGQLHYGEFMNDLSKIIVADVKDQVHLFTMNTISFFKSQWPELRANAALYLGFLMNAASTDSSHYIMGQDHMTNALLALLKDTDVSVRSKAAEAMSLLSSY